MDGMGMLIFLAYIFSGWKQQNAKGTIPRRFQTKMEEIAGWKHHGRCGIKIYGPYVETNQSNPNNSQTF